MCNSADNRVSHMPQSCFMAYAFHLITTNCYSAYLPTGLVVGVLAHTLTYLLVLLRIDWNQTAWLAYRRVYDAEHAYKTLSLDRNTHYVAIE